MNNVAKISQVSNSVKSMPMVIHMGIPVVTTDTLSSLYNTTAGNIKTNFSRNARRFVEGKHFFKLTGSILKEFKNKVTKSNLVVCASNAKHLTLWTERGAARHAKMLDTDQAWDVFEALEDFYFCKKEEAEKKPNFRQSTAKELIPLRQTAERLIAHGVGNIYPDIWKHVHAEFGVQHINELLPEQIPLAISYLDALEGEYIPAQESLPEPVGITFTEDETLALVTMCNAANFAQQEAKAMYPAFVEFGSRFTGSIYDIAHSNGILVRNGTKVLMDKLSGLRLSGKAWTGALNRLTMNA